jgi:hypothetical protein
MSKHTLLDLYRTTDGAPAMRMFTPSGQRLYIAVGDLLTGVRELDDHEVKQLREACDQWLTSRSPSGKKTHARPPKAEDPIGKDIIDIPRT